MNQPAITPATESDITALNELVNSAYRGETSRQGWTTEADLLDGIRTDEDSLRALLGTPTTTILTYKEAGYLLGCVYMDVQDDELYLGMLTVSPGAQANGIGKKLLAAADQFAVDHHCRVIAITVIPQRHELVAFYERRGYRATGETEDFPDDPRFGIPKEPLSFIVMKKTIRSL